MTAGPKMRAIVPPRVLFVNRRRSEGCAFYTGIIAVKRGFHSRNDGHGVSIAIRIPCDDDESILSQPMTMKVAKRFRWEAAHRLPWHEGRCRHLHGHSYAMTIELEGTPDEHGMVLDFKVLKRAVAPLVDAWDHAVLVAEDDEALLQAVDTLGSRRFVLPYDTTAENLCRYAAAFLIEHAGDVLVEHGVAAVTVGIQETETCYASFSFAVTAAAGTPLRKTQVVHALS